MKYFHEGNPLLNMDTVRVTVFFLRNNFSIIQTADIPVDIVDIPVASKDSKKNTTEVSTAPSGAYLPPRISGSLEISVGNIKAISQSIGPSVVKIE